jgi:outer membrane protein OmpA-like peptidoglycan-associated protein
MQLTNYTYFKLSFLHLVAFIFLSCNLTIAQLAIGDQAPNLVLSSTNNSIQSFSFPYQNKVTLLFFWSTSVSKSKENIYKYKRLYAKYSDIGYKNFDGFDVISVALQSDKVAWENAVKNYDLSKFNNCISQKGYSDFFVKTYKLTETPSSFLIDELGKIAIINPSIKSIIDYLDDKRNSQLSMDAQTVLSGKLVLGNQNSLPVSNQKVYLLNDKNDTLQTLILNEKGEFLIKNINISTAYKLLLTTNLNFVNPNDLPIFLTSENKEIISDFKKENNNYVYNLLECEIPYLKSLTDHEVISNIDADIKQLYTQDILFTAKVSTLSKEAVLKLNPIITKLKANPKTKIQIISHTDSNGDSSSNMALSLKQSNSVVTYLVTKGIAKARLTAIAKGESEISNKCHDNIPCSEQEHNVNRRTEFKFYQIL